MIKIIEHGHKNKINVSVYRHTCRNCGCLFEFNYKDMEKSQSPYFDGTVDCPECGLTNNIDCNSDFMREEWE